MQHPSWNLIIALSTNFGLKFRYNLFRAQQFDKYKDRKTVKW